MPLKISQVYPGGGVSTATAAYKKDYIELYNAGANPISLEGRSIQYQSATGPTWATVALPAVTLNPGERSPMNANTKSDEAVERVVGELLTRGGHPISVSDGSNLMQAGLTSQDGVELACDLEARLGITVPGDFNPLVHESGKRMRTLGELKAWARAQQPTLAKKGG